MGYVVGERGVKRGGKRLLPGTPLPDSIERDWHNFQAYLDGGYVDEVADEAVEPEPEPEPEYTCDECSFTTSSPQGLGAHSRIHKAEEPEEFEDEPEPPEDDDSPPDEGEEE